MHQQHSQLGFQPLQQAGKRRLSHSQAFGSAGDVPFFGNSDKGPKAAQLDHAARVSGSHMQCIGRHDPGCPTMRSGKEG